MNRVRLVSLYALFAAIATALNLTAQEASLRVYASIFAIPISIAVGTAVGLVAKFLLDKKYIFTFETTSAFHTTRIFALYVIMGLVTTAVFWGTETAFHFMFGSKCMRYLGGAIGLAIGYILKYNLDKEFVFKVIK